MKITGEFQRKKKEQDGEKGKKVLKKNVSVTDKPGCTTIIIYNALTQSISKYKKESCKTNDVET